MNAPLRQRSACPHDCPSTCALEVEVADGKIGRIRGASGNAYTAGVICAKVARYAERAHHPDRLMTPLMRTGPKGGTDFRPIGWEEALDRIAEAFLAAEAKAGAEAVWPYHYAGTMGLVQRDGIHRLRHAKGYSRQYDTICTNGAWTGYIAGTGRLAGPDPREMREADCLVIWGTNAVATQVNVMTHAAHARKTRGAKIVVVDVYANDTTKQADLALILRPGTDAALACAVMHVAFRDGYADRAYMARYADDPAGLEAHLATRTPEWAAAITGLSVEEIEAFAKIVGTTARTFFRLGYGFTRQRNGVVAMHAAASIATVLGVWQREGGGAFHNNGAIYTLDKTMIEGTDVVDRATRRLDQSQIGRILTGDAEALQGGPEVAAMLVQNTNPMVVAPEQESVRRGFAREDLFLAVHEQVMTETARMADIVLPATMFTEHDDIYKGGGHQYILLGPKLVDAPGECRENDYVQKEIARRVGAEHPGFHMTPREHIKWMLDASGYDSAALERDGWIDCQPSFEEAHYVNGFAHADGRFHFRPNWTATPAPNNGPMGPYTEMPVFPDHWDVIDRASEDRPFRLVTAPARSFLNTTFNETPGSQKREGAPAVLVHPEDAAPMGIADGVLVRLSNGRGAVLVTAKLFDGVGRGTLVCEGLYPNEAFVDGKGINTLTGADAMAPYGGAAFHDNSVRLERAGADALAMVAETA
ncbi:molybdopterin oxidoreductase family protein [Acuticoccus sp. M5D2P5]|uniref:molybdopterin oxidoreductase family protein n=1 Tax=Acuticoccus kalidii TaxID=2910977 RepID=UPI001F251C92|nr:molybdopterin oxidoreductase family protein [Acuticoccus kalidii]MCF3934505.1 molybdopterin oxidoreductase family protein [Acuticoccus kalidii]